MVSFGGMSLAGNCNSQERLKPSTSASINHFSKKSATCFAVPTGLGTLVPKANECPIIRGVHFFSGSIVLNVLKKFCIGALAIASSLNSRGSSTGNGARSRPEYPQKAAKPPSQLTAASAILNFSQASSSVRPMTGVIAAKALMLLGSLPAARADARIFSV